MVQTHNTVVTGQENITLFWHLMSNRASCQSLLQSTTSQLNVSHSLSHRTHCLITDKISALCACNMQNIQVWSGPFQFNCLMCHVYKSKDKEGKHTAQKTVALKNEIIINHTHSPRTVLLYQCLCGSHPQMVNTKNTMLLCPFTKSLTFLLPIVA